MPTAMLPARPATDQPGKTRGAARRSNLAIPAATVVLVLILGYWGPGYRPEPILLLGGMGLVFGLGLLLGRQLSAGEEARGLPPEPRQQAARPKPAPLPRHQAQEIRCNPFFELFSSSSL